MAHALRLMVACPPTIDKRAASRAHSAAQHRQLDLFGPPPAKRRAPMTPERLAEIALGVWHASKPIAGTLGERLFRDLRIETPGPDAARFCGNLKRGDTRCPGVVFLARDVRTGSPCGVVRIYLDTDGRAVERRVLGRVVGATINPRPEGARM